MKMTFITYRILQISAFIMLTVKPTNINSAFVTNITLKRPLPFLKCTVKTQFASLLPLRGSERMMCTQHAVNRSCSSNLKRRILPVSDASLLGEAITSFPASGAFSHSKRCVSVIYYSPSPRRNRPRCFLRGRRQKGALLH